MQPILTTARLRLAFAALHDLDELWALWTEPRSVNFFGMTSRSSAVKRTRQFAISRLSHRKTWA